VAAGGVMVAPRDESRSKLTHFHGAAHDGNIQDLSAILSNSPRLALEQDENGWTALQFAVRSGNLECVKLLVQKGADVNHRTNGGRGMSALFLAERYYGNDHPVATFLVVSGGLSRSLILQF
jgi:ankyrin repeat protein